MEGMEGSGEFKRTDRKSTTPRGLGVPTGPDDHKGSGGLLPGQ
jgi:hypothetical protein